jgi:hypothetical protein
MNEQNCCCDGKILRKIVPGVQEPLRGREWLLFLLHTK